MKNWCFQIVVLEKTLESPLDSKEIKLVHPKGNQPWILIETTDAEAEAPILWVSDVKRWLLEKKKKPWCGERLKVKGEGAAEEEMVGWHHQLNGREFLQTLEVSEGQGSLECCSPWDAKKSDMT